MSKFLIDEENKRQLAATAYHEAGHAVAAWHLRVKFKYVTITPIDGSSLGHLLHKHAKWFNPEVDSSDRVILRVQNRIIGNFAGQIAEAMFCGRPPRFGMHSDNEGAGDMASRVCSSQKTRNALLRYCWCATEDLVVADWRAIKAVARALLRHQTLKYAEVVEVIMPGSAALVEKGVRANGARANQSSMRTTELLAIDPRNVHTPPERPIDTEGWNQDATSDSVSKAFRRRR